MKVHTLLKSILVLPLISLLIISCEHSEKKTSEDVIIQPATIVKQERVTGQLVLPGELEGYYQTGIVAKVNGYIKRMLVDIGDKVSQGQSLVELEAPELMSQLDASYSELKVKEAMFLNSRGKFIRLKQTSKTPGAVSPYDMDMAQTTVLSDSLSFVASRSKYQSVKNLSDYLKIQAPFDGVITERSKALGAFVGPNDKNAEPILMLINQSKLRLHVAIPEKHVAEIRIGSKVEFSVETLPGKFFEGILTRVAKNVSSKTRSEMIEAEILNPQGQLLPGMYARVVIPLNRPEPSLVIPASALVTTMERSFVIKVYHSKAVWVDVEKGKQQGDRMEIFGKLVPGDTILINASEEIKKGEPLKISVAPMKDLNL